VDKRRDHFSRPATIDPTTVTVSRDPDGRWCASLAVEACDPEQAPATGSAVGVDLGIKDFAVLSIVHLLRTGVRRRAAILGEIPGSGHGRPNTR
jgi:transposase